MAGYHYLLFIGLCAVDYASRGEMLYSIPGPKRNCTSDSCSQRRKLFVPIIASQGGSQQKPLINTNETKYNWFSLLTVVRSAFPVLFFEELHIYWAEWEDFTKTYCKLLSENLINVFGMQSSSVVFCSTQWMKLALYRSPQGLANTSLPRSNAESPCSFCFKYFSVSIVKSVLLRFLSSNRKLLGYK